MLYIYNETNHELKLNYNEYNDHTLGTFELSVSNEPSPVVLLKTEDADVMQNVHKAKMPVDLNARNPYIKRLVVPKCKVGYEATEDYIASIVKTDKDQSSDDSELKKTVSRNLVVLVMKPGSRFYTGRGIHSDKPIVKYLDSATIAILFVKWHSWKDLKYPMDIKIKSVDGVGHHKRLVFGSRIAESGYPLNNITVEPIKGEFPILEKPKDKKESRQADSPRKNNRTGSTSSNKVSTPGGYTNYTEQSLGGKGGNHTQKGTMPKSQKTSQHVEHPLGRGARLIAENSVYGAFGQYAYEGKDQNRRTKNNKHNKKKH